MAQSHKSEKNTAEPGMLGKLYSLLSKRQRLIFLVIVLGTLGGTILETATLGMVLPFMDIILGNPPEQNPVLKLASRFGILPSDSKLILAMSGVLAGLFLIKGCYLVLLQWFRSRTLMHVRQDVGTALFRSALTLPYAYHLRHNSAELQRAISIDLPAIFNLINNLLILTAEGSVGLGILLYLLILSPKTTVAVVLFFSVFLLVLRFFLIPKTRHVGEISMSNATAMIRCVQQAMGALKDIYAKRSQDHFVAQYAHYADSNAKAGEWYILLAAVPRLFFENITFVCIFAGTGLIATAGGVANLLPVMATFAMAMLRLMPAANRILAAMSQVSYQSASVEEVYRLFGKRRIWVPRMEGNRPSADTEAPLRKGVELIDISFAFEGAVEPLFSGLSLHIPACKSVAFVGVTGAGKTTLADIILGLQQPTGGQVLADGRDIHAFPDWWAARIGYIPQFIYLCDDSIRVNVALGVEAKDIDDERVWRSLEMANIKNFVQGLPQGIDTVTGENGIRLSGGQRQRIGIARALYAAPEFLVMDEATSALDTETEQGIIKTVNALAGKLTLLIIAHRTSTIEHCDYVYRIKDGTVVLEKVPQEQGAAALN